MEVPIERIAKSLAGCLRAGYNLRLHEEQHPQFLVDEPLNATIAPLVSNIVADLFDAVIEEEFAKTL